MSKAENHCLVSWHTFISFLQNFTLLLFEVKQNVFADFSVITKKWKMRTCKINPWGGHGTFSHSERAVYFTVMHLLFIRIVKKNWSKKYYSMAQVHGAEHLEGLGMWYIQWPRSTWLDTSYHTSPEISCLQPHLQRLLNLSWFHFHVLGTGR